MEEYFKNISKKIRFFSLTERERLDMRLHLAAFIDEHPARMTRVMRLKAGIASITSVFTSQHAHLGYRSVAAALAAIMVAGVGTSYAAETALPGDPLYAIKINVNEPVERAVTASSQSQAQWDVTLANRRLDEAEKLAAKGALTPQNVQIVQTQLDTETQDFNQATVVTSATSTADVAAVADAQSDLEASLTAHAQILSEIASSTASSSNDIAPIVATIRAHAARTRAARIADIAALDTDSTTSLQAVASGEMDAALSQLTGVRALMATMASTSASTSVSVQIGTDASDTAQTITAGDQSLKRGRFKAALNAYQAAIRAAKEVQVNAQAQANLGTSITLPPIVGTDDATSTDDSDDTDSAATTSPQLPQGGQGSTNVIDQVLGQ